MQRFWEKVSVTAPDECWLWRASFTRGGYGQFTVPRGGRWITRRAHRVAWTLTNGPIRDGLYVCHRCDNPPCCNPAHLFLGTHHDNVKDMDAKGRRVTKVRAGEAASNAKLRETDVARIRALYATNLFPQSQLAELYELSQTGVSAIIRGQSWAATSKDPLRRPGWSKLKLAAADVAAIRSLRSEGKTLEAVARRFGVSGSQVGHIVRGEHWRKP